MLKKPEPEGKKVKTSTNELGSAEVIQKWVDTTRKTALSLDPQAYIPQLFFSQKTRLDGRIFGEARQTSITTHVVERNALGSALVKLTAPTAKSDTTQTTTTHVLAGVTAEIGQPSSDPQQGDLKITCVPTNAPLESWLQRLLVQAMDLEQLGILPGKAAFGLDISIAVLNQDGNVTDACLLAAVAALRSTTLPPIVVQKGRVYFLEGDDIRNNLPTSWTTFPSKRFSLPVMPLPLSMGVARIPPPKSTEQGGGKEEEEQQQWLVDPSQQEEAVCKGGVTVVVDGYKTDQILSLEYKGQVSMTQSNLALALRMAQGRAKELLPLLERDG